jgi:1,4-dihydroxy-2-naphthoyl-CoA synthase
MKLETMSFEKKGRVGYLTLNRPQFLNAMNYQGALDLNQAAETIRDEPAVRLVLIRGSGRAFCFVSFASKQSGMPVKFAPSSRAQQLTEPRPCSTKPRPR